MGCCGLVPGLGSATGDDRTGRGSSPSTITLRAYSVTIRNCTLPCRTDLDSQLAAADAGLQAADRALIMAPSMLGAAGPRRYLLAVQNNAEVRGTGGLVGAYVVLRLDSGSISLEAIGTNRDFRTGTVQLADLGPEYADRYGTGGPTLWWSAVGLTSDWPRTLRDNDCGGDGQERAQEDQQPLLAQYPDVVAEFHWQYVPLSRARSSTWIRC